MSWNLQCKLAGSLAQIQQSWGTGNGNVFPISHVQLGVQCIVEPEFMYILLLSSGSKHYLIAIGRDKTVERAFRISQSDSSCLVASSYIICFWIRRSDFWEDQLCGRKGQRGEERGFIRRERQDKWNWLEDHRREAARENHGPRQTLGRPVILAFDFITWSWVYLTILFHGLLIQGWE